MDNLVRILHPSPIIPSPLVAGNPRMAAAAVDAFFLPSESSVFHL